MTTKPRARKFRIRRTGDHPAAPSDGVQPDPSGAEAAPDGAPRILRAAPDGEDAPQAGADNAAPVGAETDLDAIRKEGLTGRQLRMARRVAQKHGLPVTSDFDAVRQLRLKGIDPFQRSNILELVAPGSAVPQAEAGGAVPPGGRPGLPARTGAGQPGAQLPQAIQVARVPSTELAHDDPAERRASEIRKIQKDIARRRRRKLAALFTRLAVFVGLPTLMTGWYFFVLATPMYATKSEFVIEQQESQGATPFGGLMQGTGLATQRDASGTQSYLMSREAMIRLDEELGFVAHFQNPEIDAIQRLPEDATYEDAYGIYQDRVKIGYDPTEGILKMEVVASDPAISQQFSEALIGFAEERVDQMSQRAREDAMAGALQSYEEAEDRRREALNELTTAQAMVETTDPVGLTAALQQRITALQLELDQKQVELANRLATGAGDARLAPIRSEIEILDGQIEALRAQMSESSGSRFSITDITAQLRQAEENYAFQTVLVQQALTAMETARIEADRQRIYLETNVAPIAPDAPSYPRAFEDTLLAFLIFSGIYLMVSLTASILREQVSS
ncbi:MAG: capsular polysaccharide transport system permease protein [Rhodobacteraceae bacterium HLUCCA08]|nr:MAG: capsular polysaccharide transport system permease protein [Rhodobacteraceae bacterium HLUCCA08]